MSFHDSLAASAASGHMSHFGTTNGLTYTPHGGSAATYDAIIGPLKAERRTNGDGEQLVNVRKVTVRSADLTPAMNALAQINGENYTVTGIGKPNNGLIVIELTAIEASEVTRNNYYGKR